MAIQAGMLDRTITIQRSTETFNDLNEPVLAWPDFITVRAMRRDVSDSERFAAGQIGSSLMSRFTIRSSADSRTITPKDRIVHEGSIWNIHGVKEVNEGRRRFLEITAVRSND